MSTVDRRNRRTAEPLLRFARLEQFKKVYGFDVKVGNRDSFPSGHAAAYFFFGFMAFWHHRGMYYLLLSMAVVLPIGRVMTEAHWPSDIYLGSVPLALLLSALAHETRLYRVFGLI